MKLASGHGFNHLDGHFFVARCLHEALNYYKLSLFFLGVENVSVLVKKVLKFCCKQIPSPMWKIASRDLYFVTLNKINQIGVLLHRTKASYVTNIQRIERYPRKNITVCTI